MKTSTQFKNSRVTLILEQKISNSGSIHDLENDYADRDINFAKDCKWAVVLSSYYGGKGYTTHKTERAAILASRAVRKYSHQIVDHFGNYYVPDSEDSLVNIL